jgi:long-subunit acyl-CoA synthetase (AMP-forming)
MSPVTHLVPAFTTAGKPGSIGPPVPGTECRLVDPETGEDAGPGEPGELWMRGPHVMQDYVNNPEATAAMTDADGWLHSGDRGGGRGRLVRDRRPGQGLINGLVHTPPAG